MDDDVDREEEEETDSYVIKQYHRLSVEHLFSLAGIVSTFVSTQQVGIRSNQIKRMDEKRNDQTWCRQHRDV